MHLLENWAILSIKTIQLIIVQLFFRRFSAEGVTIDFKREKPTEIKEEVVGDGTDEKPFFR